MTDDLTSWKQIATALGVNVRTAQKWERERGLPITRTPGGRVSTDAARLHAWQQRTEAQGHTTPYCYKWPLGKDVTAEVRFLGTTITAEHVELLRQYLDLVKTALQEH